VVGEKERQAGQVSVRARGGIDLGVMSLESFSDRLGDDVKSKRSSPLAKGA
jgi:threonyl-tRNA synthetase